MIEIRLYAGCARPGESQRDFIDRWLRAVCTTIINNNSLDIEHIEWLNERGIKWHVAVDKLDEYLVFEEDNDALAFKLRFGL